MKNEKRTPNLKIEGARLIFRNFQGKKTDFNEEGNRNFGVIIDSPELASTLKEDGWNIRFLPPRNPEEDEKETFWLPVKVSYKKFAPTAILITEQGKVRLTEETIDQLDWSRLKSVDLIINPYNYDSFAGRPAGISAYLQTIYATVREDDFYEKYNEIPFIGEEERRKI